MIALLLMFGCESEPHDHAPPDHAPSWESSTMECSTGNTLTIETPEADPLYIVEVCTGDRCQPASPTQVTRTGDTIAVNCDADTARIAWVVW